MAFVKKNFERIAGGQRKLFMYNAGADTIATVTGAGYFNGQNVENEIDAGDVCMVVANNNASIDNIVFTSARGVTTVAVTAVEGITAT